jgi:erythrocyte band 7 integral membrane protein
LFFCVKVSTEHARQLLDNIYNLHFFQVVKEYERAVIFRLGRLRSGGAKGPGIFFIVPCIDSYKKLDLRTVSFDVPPQEVTSTVSRPHDECIICADFVTWLCDTVSGCCGVLQSIQPHHGHQQCGGLPALHPLASCHHPQARSGYDEDCPSIFLFRNVIGTKCLAQVLSEREQISHYMETTLDEATDPWGVKVERVEM